MTKSFASGAWTKLVAAVVGAGVRAGWAPGASETNIVHQEFSF
jgi:hypothetical protein